MTVISLKDVHKKYPLGKTEVHAVKGVSFDIESGEYILTIHGRDSLFDERKIKNQQGTIYCPLLSERLSGRINAQFQELHQFPVC